MALYFLKKLIHGYNLDTNSLNNVLGIVNYSKDEILNAVKNQNYLGFQIFKKTEEVRSLFGDTINNGLILKYSSHVDSINLLRISNNLIRLESILKEESNYEKSAESGVEFAVVNGKDINPENDDKQLLLKKTQRSDRFVVYDGGYFDQQKNSKLLNRYVFEKGPAQEVSGLIYDIFCLMRYWLPKTIQLGQNETRFRVIKDFFSPNTKARTKESDIYVADTVDIKSV